MRGGIPLFYLSTVGEPPLRSSGLVMSLCLWTLKFGFEKMEPLKTKVYVVRF